MLTEIGVVGILPSVFVSHLREQFVKILNYKIKFQQFGTDICIPVPVNLFQSNSTLVLQDLQRLFKLILKTTLLCKFHASFCIQVLIIFREVFVIFRFS